MSDYYRNLGIECRDIIKLLRLNFNLGNLLKYLWRLGRKTKKKSDDLIKMVDYAMMEIEDIDEILTGEQLLKLARIYTRTLKTNGVKTIKT